MREKALYQKEVEIEHEKTQILTEIHQEKSTIQAQLMSIDSFVKNLLVLNQDLGYRSKMIDEKTKEIQYELEMNSKIKEQLSQNRQEFNYEAQKVHELSVEMSRQTENIMTSREELHKTKEDLERSKETAYSVLARSKTEKLRVESKTKDLLYRMNSFEKLKLNDKADIVIPKLETIDLDLLLKKRPSLNSTKATTMKNQFKASEYLKEIEVYSKSREEFQDYLTNENNKLLNSKITYETGLTRSLNGSLRLSQSSRSLTSSLYVNDSFSKPLESYRNSRTETYKFQ